MVKVFIWPSFTIPDMGDGGIRRVVEAQRQYLPSQDIEVVESEAEADVVAIHGGAWFDTKKPVVAHCHGLYWNEYDWDRWAHALNNDVIRVMNRADAVTAPSKWVQYAIQRGMQIDPEVIYHGVDASLWMPTEKVPYVLWNKSRPDPVCDASVLTELAARLPSVRFITTFYEGPDDALPPPNVRVCGKVPPDQMRDLVQHAAVYLATTRETFGIGTIEAMAAECAVVGYAWGAQPEIIQNGVNGWLVQPGDVDALAKDLEFLIANHAKFGKPARQHVIQNFGWEGPIKQYADLYKRIAKKHTGPRTSVVITCYNLAEYLPRAVESVLTQDDKDLEVVIVNDKSPDNTLEVAKKLAKGNPRVKLVNNAENLYLAGALNAGIAAASGRFIIPLDADNELAPGTVKLLADKLDSNPEYGISYGAMEVVEPDGSRQISSWPPDTFNFKDQLSHRNQLPSTSLYRRSLWHRVNGYRRRCRTAEDADFWCRMASFGAKPIKATDAVTLIYHNRPDSMSHVEKDWPWHEWYSWSRNPELTPYAAAQTPRDWTNVPSYEPPLVTVVIPVGPGHEDTVLDAIDSLVSQDYQNWRCIVVNDSGKDLFVPPFVQVLRTSKDGGKGPAYARNMGIRECKTTHFLPLDADDFLHPNALKILVNARKTMRDGLYYFYSDWVVFEQNKTYQAPEFNCEDVRLRLPHAVCALYPKADWSYFDADLDSWEDWDFVLNLIKNGYCGVRVPYALLYYRVTKGNRREAMNARADEAKENITKKWHNVLIEKADMGCGCGGGRTQYVPPPMSEVINGSASSTNNLMAAVATNNDMVLLRFIAPNTAERSYRGAVTGTTYRFGSDPDVNQAFVFAADAARLLERSQEFQLANVEMSDVQLEAAGAPSR